MHKITVVLLAVFGACAHRHGPQSDSIACGQDDESVVWQIAFASVAAPAAHRGNVVLESPTTLGLLQPNAQEIAEPFRSMHIDLPDELVAHFLAANRSSVDLTKACKSDNHVRLATSAEVKDIFHGSDVLANWEAFAGKYDDAAGLLTLSRAGFHRDLALINAEFSCGGLCGHGHLLLLRRAGGTWVVQADVVTWIS